MGIDTPDGNERNESPQERYESACEAILDKSRRLAFDQMASGILVGNLQQLTQEIDSLRSGATRSKITYNGIFTNALNKKSYFNLGPEIDALKAAADEYIKTKK